ncbi:MAG TPA: hypothetical protein VER98_16455 [Terriglobia bacterium]|nr:hypothetical protein [Terriglobia bacterium]
MKTLCGLLVTVLLAHLVCGGSCLAESFGVNTHATSTNTAPPCHKAAEIPSKSPQPSDERSGVCSQGPLVESKLSIGGIVVLQSTAVLPASIFIVQPSDSAIAESIPENPPGVLRLLIPISILRI